MQIFLDQIHNKESRERDRDSIEENRMGGRAEMDDQERGRNMFLVPCGSCIMCGAYAGERTVSAPICNRWEWAACEVCRC